MRMMMSSWINICLAVLMLQLYYANRNYYTLEASKEVDNPDQRIAEDIRAFTKDSLELFITALTAVIDLGVSLTTHYPVSTPLQYRTLTT